MIEFNERQVFTIEIPGGKKFTAFGDDMEDAFIEFVKWHNLSCDHGHKVCSEKVFHSDCKVTNVETDEVKYMNAVASVDIQYDLISTIKDTKRRNEVKHSLGRTVWYYDDELEQVCTCAYYEYLDYYTPSVATPFRYQPVIGLSMTSRNIKLRRWNKEGTMYEVIAMYKDIVTAKEGFANKQEAVLLPNAPVCTETLEELRDLYKDSPDILDIINHDTIGS